MLIKFSVDQKWINLAKSDLKSKLDDWIIKEILDKIKEIPKKDIYNIEINII